MGRTEKLPKDRLMTPNEVAAHLLRTCRSLSLSEFESYMFGSFLTGVGSDIDILIVGPSGEKLATLKQEIATAGRELPLDILYMDRTEALETDFISSQRCVMLLRLALAAV
jgi:predicted nucleotidyltransferase